MNNMVGKCIMLANQPHRIVFQDQKIACLINMNIPKSDVFAIELSAIC